MDKNSTLKKAIATIGETVAYDWERIAIKLNATRADIEQVKKRYPDDYFHQCHHFLENVWWQQEGSQATVEKLCDALQLCKLNKTRDDIHNGMKDTTTEEEVASCPGTGSTPSLNSKKKEATKIPCVLILAEEWDNPGSPFVTVARTMADMLAKNSPHMQVIYTVLEHTQNVLESCPVRILYPVHIEDDLVTSKRRRLRDYFGTYYLSDLRNHQVNFIIALSPLTADAVSIIREKHFRDAKVINVNTCIPSEAPIWLDEVEPVPDERAMIQWSEQADIVVSVGSKVFDFYKSKLVPDKVHLMYIPMGFIQCTNDHLQPCSQRKTPTYAFSCQPGPNVHEPVAEAVEHLTASNNLSHWNIYTKSSSQMDDKQTTPYCTFITIPSNEDKVHSSLCDSSIYIDSLETNPMWSRGLDAINHCVPFCTGQNSHLAKTLAYFEELVDQYFVECSDEIDNWERKIKKGLAFEKLHKMVHLRRDILLPKATLLNHKLITSIHDHVTLIIGAVVSSKPEVNPQISENITNTLAREFYYRNPLTSLLNLLQSVIQMVIIAVKRPRSIRLALVASGQQTLDEFYDRSQTVEFSKEVGNVILSQTSTQEWMTSHHVAREDITFTAHIDEEGYIRYRRTLDSTTSEREPSSHDSMKGENQFSITSGP